MDAGSRGLSHNETCQQALMEDGMDVGSEQRLYLCTIAIKGRIVEVPIWEMITDVYKREGKLAYKVRVTGKRSHVTVHYTMNLTPNGHSNAWFWVTTCKTISPSYCRTYLQATCQVINATILPYPPSKLYDHL
jgi:hypothetical protein